MYMRSSWFAALVFGLVTLASQTFAQTSDRQPTNPATASHSQSPDPQSSSNSTEIVASELGLLRKSVQSLTTKLRELIDTFLAPARTNGDSANDKQKSLSASLDLLTRAEQRAELLRKQLLELIEKEASFRSRLIQIEEDMRPENIERSMNLPGSTRPAELRDARRRVLDSDRKGIESLLSQTTQSRIRLDDDVRSADAMVSRLRQRLLPLIEKEIEEITPN